MSIDPATIGASISAVRDVVKRFSDTTWKSQIVELTDLLMDVQGKAMDLLIELQATKARVIELEAELAQERRRDAAEGLSIDHGVYWSGPEREVGADGPYCTRCVTVSRLRMLMKEGGGGSAQCPNCETWYHNVWPDKARAVSNAAARHNSNWINRR